MRALDTNVLLRLVVRDDARQAQAAAQFVAKGAWVSHLVLSETVWVLSAVYQRNAQQLQAALEFLLSHQTLVLQDAETVAGALANFGAKPKRGFSDCLVLEIARKAGHLPLATFDKALAGLDGAQKL